MARSTDYVCRFNLARPADDGYTIIPWNTDDGDQHQQVRADASMHRLVRSWLPVGMTALDIRMFCVPVI